MIEIIQSDIFAKWLAKLKDGNAKTRITAPIVKMEEGSLGDVKPVGGGISEARIHYGPGYRLYFSQRGKFLIIMLAGGDKRTQQTDIAKAIKISNEWKG